MLPKAIEIAIESMPQIGDRVVVVRSEYTRAAPPGTIGRVVRYAPQDDGAQWSVDREDGEGIGWAEEVRLIP